MTFFGPLTYYSEFYTHNLWKKNYNNQDFVKNSVFLSKASVIGFPNICLLWGMFVTFSWNLLTWEEVCDRRNLKSTCRRQQRGSEISGEDGNRGQGLKPSVCHTSERPSRKLDSVMVPWAQMRACSLPPASAHLLQCTSVMMTVTMAILLLWYCDLKSPFSGNCSVHFPSGRDPTSHAAEEMLRGVWEQSQVVSKQHLTKHGWRKSWLLWVATGREWRTIWWPVSNTAIATEPLSIQKILYCRIESTHVVR